MYLRLRSRGYECATAAERLRIDGKIAIELDDALNRVANRFRYSKSLRATLPDGLSDRPALAALLTRIPESGWNDLIMYAEQRFAESSLLPNGTPIDPLVTTSRQIVIWDVEHFSSLRSHLDWWGMATDQLRVYASPKCSDALLSKAAEYGFKPDSYNKTPRPQIDLVRTGPRGEFKVEQRLAVVLQEGEHPIRHAAEFCLCLVVSSILPHIKQED